MERIGTRMIETGTEQAAQAMRYVILGAEMWRSSVSSRLNITATDMVALGYLSHNTDVTARELVDSLSLPSSSVTQLTDRLAATGYVVRRANPEDRRSVIIDATDAGRAVVQEAFENLLGATGRSLEGFTGDDTLTIIRFLQRLSQEIQP